MQNKIVEQLKQAAIPSPRLEAKFICEHTSDPEQISRIIKKRLAGWPLDKLLGHKGFYKYEFLTSQDVLSPRPDTEVLVEKAIALVKKSPSRILDLGTGSGCIILSVLKDCQNAAGTAVDVSEKALEIARQNAKNLDLEARIRFINASWFAPSFPLFAEKFDLIVSNPPYIPSAEIKTLAPEVKDHDPMAALDGGEDGCESYKKIAQHCQKLLADKGDILLEVGINQAPKVAEIFASYGFALCETIKDLGGIDRCLHLKP